MLSPLTASDHDKARRQIPYTALRIRPGSLWSLPDAIVSTWGCAGAEAAREARPSPEPGGKLDLCEEIDTGGYSEEHQRASHDLQHLVDDVHASGDQRLGQHVLDGGDADADEHDDDDDEHDVVT
jgi:hypothetical protein